MAAVSRAQNSSGRDGPSAIPDGMLLDLLLAFAPNEKHKLVKSLQDSKIANY